MNKNRIILVNFDVTFNSIVYFILWVELQCILVLYAELVLRYLDIFPWEYFLDSLDSPIEYSNNCGVDLDKKLSYSSLFEYYLWEMYVLIRFLIVILSLW